MDRQRLAALHRAVEAILSSSAHRLLRVPVADRGRLQAWEKERGQVVSIADVSVELSISINLSALLPQSEIASEEQNPLSWAAVDAADNCWVLDPIDGSHHYLRGDPYFTILASLLQSGVPVISWMAIPSQHQVRSVLGLTHSVPNAQSTPCVMPRGLRILSDPTWRAQWGDKLNAASSADEFPQDIHSAGFKYFCLLENVVDLVLLNVQHYWDHLAGLHLVAGRAGYFLFICERGIWCGPVVRTFGSTLRRLVFGAGGLMAVALREEPIVQLRRSLGVCPTLSDCGAPQ